MANPQDTSSTAEPGAGKVQGEGDYVSARKYQKEQHAFASSGEVETKAKEAEAALDGPEGAELEAARQETAKGHPRRN